MWKLLQSPVLRWIVIVLAISGLSKSAICATLHVVHHHHGACHCALLGQGGGDASQSDRDNETGDCHQESCQGCCRDGLPDSQEKLQGSPSSDDEKKNSERQGCSSAPCECPAGHDCGYCMSQTQFAPPTAQVFAASEFEVTQLLELTAVWQILRVQRPLRAVPEFYRPPHSLLPLKTTLLLI